MRKKLRIISFVMLVIAVLWIAFAIFTMDSTITLPIPVYHALRIVYRIYPFLMIALFAASFFVRDGK